MAREQLVGKGSEESTSGLLSAAQAGHMSAFEKLVERSRDRVYALALQMTRSETCALDIAQRSFLYAFRHLNEFRTESDFDTGVRRISIAYVCDAASRWSARSIRLGIQSAEADPADDLRSAFSYGRCFSRRRSLAIQW